MWVSRKSYRDHEICSCLLEPHVRFLIAFGAVALVSAAPAQPPATLDVDLHNLRNTRGVIQACLTRDPRHFPNCERDPAAIHTTAAASTKHIRLGPMPGGHYALSLFHDENSNKKLDTMMGMPREGFGFSRSPVVRFGPPKFENVAIDLVPGANRASVRMQYLL